MDEGGFKLPEKARRSSGYTGVSHVLLPLYSLKETLNLHLPIPRGVCPSNKVDYKEYCINDCNSLRPVEKNIQLLNETAPSRTAIKGLSCFFANVTSFSTKVKHFIRLNRHKWHVVALLGTHGPTRASSFWNQLSYEANI